MKSIILNTFLVVCFQIHPDALNFDPEVGSTLTKTFSTHASLRFEGMNSLFDGLSGPPRIVMGSEWKRSVTVTDEYLVVREGRPERLRRRFEKLALEFSHELEIDREGRRQADSDRSTATSRLEGARVLFELDPELDRTVPSWDAPGEALDLSGLTEDMDLRGLLPPSEVGVGESWQIDPSVFLLVFAPGGDLGLVRESRTTVDPQLRFMGLDPSLTAHEQLFGAGALGDIGKGTSVTARYVSIDEAGIARVEIAFELSTSWGLGAVDAAEKARLFGESPIDVGEATLKFTLKGQGELLWDTRAGHLRELDLVGAAKLVHSRPIYLDPEHESTSELRWTGEVRTQVSVR